MYTNHELIATDTSDRPKRLLVTLPESFCRLRGGQRPVPVQTLHPLDFFIVQGQPVAKFIQTV